MIVLSSLFNLNTIVICTLSPITSGIKALFTITSSSTLPLTSIP
nr:MAG TPA: hypothetical protein [Caudoviricetes sp.]DAR39142.1 MAG TPA: hypothetical protein [Caudoviricetes sp.]